MSSLRRFLFMFSIIAISTSSSAQELFNGKEPIAFSFLQKVLPTQSIGGYPILNIGGEWKLVHLKTTYSSGMASGLPLGNTYMVDIRDNKFFAAFEMQGNLESMNMSDWVDEPCKRNNFLWKRSIGGQFKDINCVSINHHTKYFTSPTGDFQQYLAQFRQIGLEIPPTVIRIEFTRYSNNGRRLLYKVTVNPELFGFERDSEPLWGTNSWYKDFSLKDSRKAEFIASLAKWAEDVQNRIDDAFDKKMGAFSGVAAFPSYSKIN